jgi:hypothetical protein
MSLCSSVLSRREASVLGLTASLCVIIRVGFSSFCQGISTYQKYLEAVTQDNCATLFFENTLGVKK